MAFRNYFIALRIFLSHICDCERGIKRLTWARHPIILREEPVAQKDEL